MGGLDLGESIQTKEKLNQTPEPSKPLSQSNFTKLLPFQTNPSQFEGRGKRPEPNFQVTLSSSAPPPVVITTPWLNGSGVSMQRGFSAPAAAWDRIAGWDRCGLRSG